MRLNCVLSIYIVYFCVVTSVSSSGDGCRIDISSLNVVENSTRKNIVCLLDPLGDLRVDTVITTTIYEPIVVSGDPLQFLYPDPSQNSTEIHVNTSQSIIVACPQGILLFAMRLNGDYKEGTCVFGSIFEFDTTDVAFPSIKCSTKLRVDTIRETGKSCANNGIELEIGFLLQDDVFVRLILTCFNTQYLLPVYSTFNLTKSIKFTAPPIPSKDNDEFYQVAADYLYEKNLQGSIVASLDPSAQTYFFDKGYLASAENFVYMRQQYAAFYYVNVAPQWENLKNGNWKMIEEDVRSYATDMRLDLVIYTGTYGITSTEGNVQIFLHATNNIPVPALFWKLVYEPNLELGVVLISVNNPYKQQLKNICDDMSADIDWLKKWSPSDENKGRSYACTLSDFNNAVNYLPELNDGGLLNDSNLSAQVLKRYGTFVKYYLDKVGSIPENIRST